jgi:hypothetical protein
LAIILALANLWQIDPATDWEAAGLHELVLGGLRP